MEHATPTLLLVTAATPALDCLAAGLLTEGFNTAGLSVGSLTEQSQPFPPNSTASPPPGARTQLYFNGECVPTHPPHMCLCQPPAGAPCGSPEADLSSFEALTSKHVLTGAMPVYRML